MRHFKMSKTGREIMHHFLSGIVFMMCGCSSILSSYWKADTVGVRIILLSIMIISLIFRVIFIILEHYKIIEIDEPDAEELINLYESQRKMLVVGDLIMLWGLLGSLIVSLFKFSNAFQQIKFVEGLSVLVGFAEISRGIIISDSMNDEDLDDNFL